jgi:hypothetical protein
MRRPVDAERIRRFMRALGGDAPEPDEREEGQISTLLRETTGLVDANV